jgi:predicted Zn finger-like uncharacterized protein
MATRCPSCNKRIRIAEHLRGKLIRCSNCSASFVAASAPTDDWETDQPQVVLHGSSSPLIFAGLRALSEGEPTVLNGVVLGQWVG